MLTKKEKELLELLQFKLNSEGKYPSYSELQKEMGYASKRSIGVLIEKLVEKGEIRKIDGNIRLTRIHANHNDDTIDVPLIGEVSCGIPIFAEQNIQATIAISTKFAKPGNNYFLLSAYGKSMNVPKNGNRGIKSGDLVLVKVQKSAEDKDWVVALVNNEATIKEYYKGDNHVVLKPSSTENFQPMILHDDFQIQGIVITSFSNLL